MDDPEVVAALRPFARAAVPVLAVLAEPDLFRLHGRAIGAVANIDGVDPKYLARFAALPNDLTARIGALMPLLVASTSVDRRALTLAERALVVCAEADTVELRVRVLAGVLYGRDVNAAPSAATRTGRPRICSPNSTRPPADTAASPCGRWPSRCSASATCWRPSRGAAGH